MSRDEFNAGCAAMDKKLADSYRQLDDLNLPKKIDDLRLTMNKMFDNVTARMDDTQATLSNLLFMVRQRHHGSTRIMCVLRHAYFAWWCIFKATSCELWRECYNSQGANFWGVTSGIRAQVLSIPAGPLYL
jgi:hypothetical protein